MQLASNDSSVMAYFLGSPFIVMPPRLWVASQSPTTAYRTISHAVRSIPTFAPLTV